MISTALSECRVELAHSMPNVERYLKGYGKAVATLPGGRSCPQHVNAYGKGLRGKRQEPRILIVNNQCGQNRKLKTDNLRLIKADDTRRT